VPRLATRGDQSRVTAPLRIIAVSLCALIAAGAFALVSSAKASTQGASPSSTGGAVFHGPPSINNVRCERDCPNSENSTTSQNRVVAQPGSTIVVTGTHMDDVATIAFAGGRTTSPEKSTPNWVSTKVPYGAASGKVRVIGKDGRKSSPSKIALKVVDPEPQNVNKFLWPLKRGLLTSPFGPRWGRLHAGLDIADKTGTPIRASADGEVILSGSDGAYGENICIRHTTVNGPLVTCYAHQSRRLARVGDAVKQGQTIGYVGCTGSCTGPHVHFETRVGSDARSTPVDPMRYVRRPAGASAAGASGVPLHPDFLERSHAHPH
jgi:hypothetical protein